MVLKFYFSSRGNLSNVDIQANQIGSNFIGPTTGASNLTDSTVTALNNTAQVNMAQVNMAQVNTAQQNSTAPNLAQSCPPTNQMSNPSQGGGELSQQWATNFVALANQAPPVELQHLQPLYQQSDALLEQYSFGSPQNLMAVPTERFAGPLLTTDFEPAEISLLCSGSPELGQIHYIRQIHTTYSESQGDLSVIGSFQGRILDYLKQNQFQHVFVESQTETFFGNDALQAQALGKYYYWLLPDYLRNHVSNQHETLHDYISNLFGNHSETSPYSAEQQLFLGALGAACIYAILNPSVSLHRTIQPEVERHLCALQASLNNCANSSKILKFSFREIRALSHVKEFLDYNCRGTSDSPVALVYGAEHLFSDAIQNVWMAPPEISAVDWPRARACTMEILRSKK